MQLLFLTRGLPPGLSAPLELLFSLSLSPLSASTQSFVPNWVIHRLKRGVTFAVPKRNQSLSARFFYLKEKSPLEGLNHFYLMIYSQWCRGSLNFSPISWNKKSFSLHPLKMPFQHEAYQDAPLTEVECNNRELKKGKATHGSCSAADCQYLSPPPLCFASWTRLIVLHGEPTEDTSTCTDSITSLLPSRLWMLWRCEKKEREAALGSS